MRGVAGDDGRHLHARRSRTNDADALAREVDRLLRPLAAVQDAALEAFLARIVRAFRRRELPHAEDETTGGPDSAVFRGDGPAAVVLVIDRRLHPRVEADVSTQVEPVGDMLDVAQDLRLRRVALAPAPFLLELGRETVRVIVAFHVAARAGIAVVAPDATHAIAGFEHDDAAALRAERMQRPEASETGADDEDVNPFHSVHPDAVRFNIPSTSFIYSLVVQWRSSLSLASGMLMEEPAIEAAGGVSAALRDAGKAQDRAGHPLRDLV